MDTNYKPYDYTASFARLDTILGASSSGNYEEVDTLPDRDRLTFSNGFYAYCTALFIDIRDSSSLPNSYKRPRLAKIYRAFISEMVAVFNSDQYVREVNIVGDCVWAVYNTPITSDIDDVFSVAARANSLVDVLDYKMRQLGYITPLKCGIGISYGRALMIKAGFSGSGINDVVYMGDVVNEAAKLAAQGCRGFNDPIQVNQVFYQNLNETNQKLLTMRERGGRYEGNVVNNGMHDWFKENCT